MTEVALWVSDPYLNNKIFSCDKSINRDDCLAPYRYLKDKGEEHKLVFNTYDIYKSKEVIPDVVLFFDIPLDKIENILGSWYQKVKIAVILFECEVVWPENWKRSRHEEFDVIYTWDLSLVDNRRYHPIKFPQVISSFDEVGLLEKKKKLCVSISANKKSTHQNQLYSYREEAIDWFERNHPDKFDFYGYGWGSYVFKPDLAGKILNRLPLLKNILAKRYACYKGIVESKISVMRDYKFSICFENAKAYPGYITEKIFDPMMSGSVPIYRGAPDISAYVDESCFISTEDFKNFDDLYLYISTISDQEYIDRVMAIKAFIESERPSQFSVSSFYENIVTGLSRNV